MTPYIDPRDHGALGDGVADDTAAIQAGIDAAGAVSASIRGGTVWFPRGAYKITAPLRIPNFVRLTGVGHPMHTAELGSYGDPPAYYGADIFAAGPLNFHMFVNADTTNGNTGIEIDHLRLDQRGVTGDNDIMRFTRLWRSEIHHIDFLGATTTTNRRGVNVTTGEEVQIQRNRFDNCGIRAADNAYTIERNDIGAGAIYGIELPYGFGNTVDKNHIYNATKHGIFGAGQVGATFTLNKVEDCQWHGMYFANSLVHSTIAHNVCNQNSRIGAGQANGITIDSDTAGKPSTDNIVSGNQCLDAQAVKTQGYGIALVSYSGSQTNGNLVTGNMLTGNKTGGLYQKPGLLNTTRDNVGVPDPARIISGSVTLG